MNEGDPGQRVQFYEWFQHKTHEDEFVSNIVWSHEATFKFEWYSESPLTVCTGLQKIHTFMWTRWSIYSLTGVDCHAGV
jgi:hypothetical protein